MRLKIKSYDDKTDSYLCSDQLGKWHHVDFHVCGSEPIKKYYERKTLIGKSIVIDELLPSMEIARNVFAIED